MDIHKPKPIRSWREFLKEYAIIVLGVATALAGEQAVEWLHWQGEVKAARQAIFSEMTFNNSYFVKRVVIGSCLERQADEAGRILDDLAANRPPGRFTVFHPGAHILLNDSDWQSQRAAQSLIHFPRAELAQMGRYYALLPLMRVWLDQEADAWRALSVLRDPPRQVPVSDVLRLREALATARWTEFLWSLNAGRQVNLSRGLGIPDAPLDRVRVEKFCNLDDDAYMTLPPLARTGVIEHGKWMR